MARTGRPITDTEKLKKKVKFSSDWEFIHKVMKKDSTSRVSKMLKWKKWQEDHDVEGMCDIYEEEGIFDLIEETEKINDRLHDRTRRWTAAKNKITGLTGSIQLMEANIEITLRKLPDVEDQTEIDRLTNAIADARVKIEGWKAEIPVLEATMDEIEAYQWESSRQVSKNFCKVHDQIIELGGGNPDIQIAEDRDAFDDYEYRLKDY